MNKRTFFILLIIALVASNAFLIYNQMQHGFSPDKPRDIIIKRLGFDDKQIEQYQVLINAHRSQMRVQDSTMKVLRNKLYHQLLAPNDGRVMDSLYAQIGAEQVKLEQINLHHFADIKALCRVDQQDSFNQLVNDLAGIFSLRKPPPPHRK